MRNTTIQRPVGPHLSSLDSGLQVMTMFSSHQSVNVTQVAEHLGCSRSTAYRVLNTLRNRGIVMLGPGGRGYYPGPVLVDLARPRGLDLVDRVRFRPVIDKAVELTGETVHVGALVGSHIVFFDGREPDRAVRAQLTAGYFRPAHAISAGKLLLSDYSDDQVAALFPGERLPKETPWTTDSVSALIAEMPAIREQGYVLNFQQTEAGLAGCSVPVPGRGWRERVALCATVPVSRGTREELMLVRDGLVEAASLFR
ncbi:IclR family transcriptional regulator [Janibacter terrae]|uniref:IclR family transcriptional regulator n=1 Tax=Janibacter terrae TaxID=103817 RepID=UPI000838B2D0|nr:IclR family transcriptional regulator C-terminal domain-containing protein [Janibacter terrae]